MMRLLRPGGGTGIGTIGNGLTNRSAHRVFSTTRRRCTGTVTTTTTTGSLDTKASTTPNDSSGDLVRIPSARALDGTHATVHPIEQGRRTHPPSPCHHRYPLRHHGGTTPLPPPPFSFSSSAGGCPSLLQQLSQITRCHSTHVGGGGDGANDEGRTVDAAAHHGNEYDGREPGRLVVSILGPPNAGKSTLFNRIMCKESNRAYRLASEKQARRPKRSKGRIGSKNPSKQQTGAIVSAVPGTTRDRRECIGRIAGTYFTLIDTAGVDSLRLSLLSPRKHESETMEASMVRQTLEAARESDLVLLLFDARVGVTNDMEEVVRWLRGIGSSDAEGAVVESGEFDDRMDRRVVVLANKLEGDGWANYYDGDSKVMEHLVEVARLGFGEAVPISAEHGEGLADVAVLIERLTREKRERLGLPPVAATIDHGNKNNKNKKNNKEKTTERSKDINPEQPTTPRTTHTPTSPTQPTNEKPLQLAILGRQNVGKSTLVNTLLSTPRVIAGPTPGLTRDAISIHWTWNSRPVTLIDTAGIRRSARRDPSGAIEDRAVADAVRALNTADVAVLVLDAEARVLQRQELAIADAVVREGRALVVVANKMDLLVGKGYSGEDYADGVRRQIGVRFPQLRNTPVVAMSSKEGVGVEDLMPVVFTARERWERVIPTGVLNRWLMDVVDMQAPPMRSGRAVRLKYVVQTKGRPPTFLLFCNVDSLPISYTRYLVRNFQESFGMFGMGVRIAVKKSVEVNPFEARGGGSGSSGGSGVGGKEGHKKRNIQALKTTGKARKKGLRRRTERK